MKAKHHLTLGLGIMFILVVLLIKLHFDGDFEIMIKNFGWLSSLMEIMNIKPQLLILGMPLYIIGLLLPDSDSKDAGSRIFYTKFFIFGWLNRFLEYPLSKILKRPIGHRESLHTIFGIIFTSFVFGLIIAILLSLVFKGISLSGTTFFLFLSLLFGQMVHLLGDWHWEFK